MIEKQQNEKEDKLTRARKYEQEKAEPQDAENRPAFHVTPPVGWMNDPNGFSLYQGEYHLFYQYHPYSTQWGPMHWGHCKTKDFVKWEQLPCALAPDTDYDGQGCFPDPQWSMRESIYSCIQVSGNWKQKTGHA